MTQTVHLALAGLSCDHCVAQVKKILEQRPDVTSAQVSVTAAKVVTHAEPASLIETITQQGYQARLDG